MKSKSNTNSIIPTTANFIRSQNEKKLKKIYYVNFFLCNIILKINKPYFSCYLSLRRLLNIPYPFRHNRWHHRNASQCSALAHPVQRIDDSFRKLYSNVEILEAALLTCSATIVCKRINRPCTSLIDFSSFNKLFRRLFNSCSCRRAVSVSVRI